jgi:hypothetical protein
MSVSVLCLCCCMCLFLCLFQCLRVSVSVTVCASTNLLRFYIPHPLPGERKRHPQL